MPAVDRLEVYDGTTRDARFTFAKVTGRGTVTHVAKTRSWPQDNSGFGKRQVVLRYRTPDGTMVKVAEVPIELYFDPAAKKSGKPAWAVYWAANDGANDRVCPLLTSDIKIVDSVSRGAAYQPKWEATSQEGIEVKSGTGSRAEPWEFRFPVAPKYDSHVPTWSKVRRAAWRIEERTDIVQMALAHEMTHREAFRAVLGQAKMTDGDHDFVPDDWEKELGWNGMTGDDAKGLHKKKDSFGAMFTGSASVEGKTLSDQYRDNEFYAWICPVFSTEKWFGVSVQFKDNKRPKYLGIVPTGANHKADWSYLGYNWNRQGVAGLQIAIQGIDGTTQEGDGKWPSPASLTFTLKDTAMAAKVKSYKWSLSRVPAGAKLAGETTATFTASKLEVVREPNEHRQPYGGFTVTVEIVLKKPDKFNRSVVYGG
ncbi:MAG: hypothetical protein JXA57_11600, partial [Armatimonadetes bacterium]|nr:hypothetical protein [Armatimonadota bacterium]